MVSTTIRPAAATNASKLTRYRLIPGPLGEFALMLMPDGQLRSNWLAAAPKEIGKMQRDDRLLGDLARRLKAFFAGEAVGFSDVATPEGSEFFVRCWNACRAIPRGRTISYGQLAERAGGSWAASRAAGQAMRRNPLPVIVPCHRVVASTGRLHGFGGSTDPHGRALRLKRGLLALEGAMDPLLPA